MTDNNIIMQVLIDDESSETNDSLSDDISSEESDHDYPTIELNSTHNDESVEPAAALDEQTILDSFLIGNIDLNECLLKMKLLSNQPINMEMMSEMEKDSENSSMTSPVHFFNTNRFKNNRSAQQQSIKPTNRLDNCQISIIGQAHVELSKGDLGKAFQLCFTVLKQQPRSSVPYHVLSMLYESQQNHESALQMKLMACLVGPTFVSQWIELSDMFKDSGDLRQAITCLTKAINTDTLNVELYDKRFQLCREFGDEDSAMKGYERIYYKLNPENYEKKIAEIAKLLGKYYLDGKNYDAVKKVFTHISCLTFFKNLIDVEGLNYFFEALIKLENFKTFFDTIKMYFDLNITYSSKKEFSDDDEIIKIETCELPENLDKNTLSKIIVALIKLGMFEFVDIYLKRYENQNLNEIGNCLYDFSEAFIVKEKFENALKFLNLLIKSSLFNTRVDVLKNLAICYKALNNVEKLLECYYKIVQLDSEDLESRMILIKKLKYENRLVEAIDLTKNIDGLNRELLYERCLICYQLEDYEKFLESGYKLLSFHMNLITDIFEINLISMKVKCDRDHKHLIPNYEKFNDKISLEDEWDICMKIIRTYLIQKNNYDILQQFTFSLILSEKFRPKKKEINFIIVISCILNRDYSRAYEMLKQVFTIRNIMTNQIWNLFNLLVVKVNYSRINKFLVRYIKRESQNFAGNLMYANYSLISGSYMYALNDYYVLFKKKKDPFLAMQVAVTSIQLACQKHASNKPNLVTQAIYFLKEYEKLRGRDMLQEIYYNSGRMFHQIGFISDAVYFYKKTLETKPVFSDMIEKFDLTQEAAFNLALIYRESGNEDLEEYYIQKYIVI